MKNILRLIAAAFLVGVLVVVAGGVWAAPVFQGTIPPPPPGGEGGTTGEAIDMGTALFTPQCTDCTVTVTLVEDPGSLAAVPTGKAFLGDTFEVTIDQPDSTVEICYAYPQALADKSAKIYKLNTAATPPVWVEVPGAVISNGMICVTSGAGTFSLIGNP
jgi:hypothetical protein